MTNFTVEYLNPCEKDATSETLFREGEVINKFESIDWFQHALDVVYAHNPPEAGVEYNEALHDYYYFSVEYKDFDQHVHTLNIVASINNGYVESKDDVLFDIEYRRPKLVATSKLAQLFGKAKEKLEPEYMSHGKEFSMSQTINYIGHFMRFEQEHLNAKLDIEGYLY